jgi:hypothetical protein
MISVAVCQHVSGAMMELSVGSEAISNCNAFYKYIKIRQLHLLVVQPHCLL